MRTASSAFVRSLAARGAAASAACVLPVAVLAALCRPAAADAKGMTVETCLRCSAAHRIAEPAVSPDGKWVAFLVRDTDYEANRGRTDVWMAAVDGSSMRRLNTHPEADTSPAWSADGRWIYFTSTRSGSSQVWRIGPDA